MSRRYLELVFRLGAVVCGIGALVPACIAVSRLQGLSDIEKGIVNAVYESLEDNTNAAVALVIIAAVVTAIVEILFIVIRFASTGVNFNKILVLLDIILTALMGATFGTAGVIGATATQTWSDLIDAQQIIVLQNYIDIRDPLAATAAFALAAALLLILLIVWMVLSLIFNKRMLNYNSV